MNVDEQQRATPFIKHREKFIQGLAKTDPERFLYTFRDAFGQKQPENVQPLRGWDSATTRLRGHATGHYLSASAKAYASTGYDPALQAYRTDRFSGWITDQAKVELADPTSLAVVEPVK